MTTEWTKVKMYAIDVSTKSFRNIEMNTWLEENVGPLNEDWQSEWGEDEFFDIIYSFREPKMATLFLLRWS